MTVAEAVQTEQGVAQIAAAVNGEPAPPQPSGAPGRARDERGRFTTPETQARAVEGWNAVLEREAKAAGKEYIRFDPDKKAEPSLDARPDTQPPAAKADAPEAKPKETVAQDKGKELPKEDSAYEHAIKALRLDGFKTEDLDGLGRDRVVALGEKAAKRQADISQKLDDHSRKASEKAAAALAAAEAPKAQPLVLKDAAKDFAEKFAIPPEEAEPALAKLSEVIAAPLRTELEANKALLQQVVGALVQLQAVQARGKLPEEIRGLTDEAEYEAKTVPKALQLYANGQGGYESFEDALRDAQLIIAGPRLTSQAASVRAKKTDQREHGQLSPIEQRTPPKAKSRDDRLFAAFQAIERGATLEEARAAFG